MRFPLRSQHAPFVLVMSVVATAAAQEQQTQTTTTQQQAQPPPPPPSNLGGPGESCRARSDCKAGLKCTNQTCRDEHEGETCGATSDCGGELKCVGGKCVSPLSTGRHASTGSSGEWMSFRLTDGAAHPFVGVTGAGGFDTLGFGGRGAPAGFNFFDGSALFAVNGGVFIGHSQIMFEVAPVTFVYDAKAPGPVFEANVSYAYFIPISESGDVQVYWPIRIGAGIFAGPNDNAGGLAFFQARADLIDLAIKVGHLMMDFHLPTFRWAITDQDSNTAFVLEWLFGLSVSYVF